MKVPYYHHYQQFSKNQPVGLVLYYFSRFQTLTTQFLRSINIFISLYHLKVESSTIFQRYFFCISCFLHACYLREKSKILLPKIRSETSKILLPKSEASISFGEKNYPNYNFVLIILFGFGEREAK